MNSETRVLGNSVMLYWRNAEDVNPLAGLRKMALRDGKGITEELRWILTHPDLNMLTRDGNSGKDAAI